METLLRILARALVGRLVVMVLAGALAMAPPLFSRVRPLILGMWVVGLIASPVAGRARHTQDRDPRPRRGAGPAEVDGQGGAGEEMERRTGPRAMGGYGGRMTNAAVRVGKGLPAKPPG